TDLVDRIELDELGHHSLSLSLLGGIPASLTLETPASELRSSVAPLAASCDCESDGSPSGSGRRSSTPPVSLHFTIITPYVWKSNSVTDAGDTLIRWNESRCMPV